jgi:hypothetical protein
MASSPSGWSNREHQASATKVDLTHMSNLREIATAKLRGTPVEKPVMAVVGSHYGRRAVGIFKTTTREFNDWRAAYDRMPFAEQQTYYDKIAPRFPDQAHYNLASALNALTGATTVTEVGGWRGDLARDALATRADITSWHNYDICTWALDHPKFASPRYEGIVLTDWPWNTDLQPADAFVATHVIEHIRFSELEQLAQQFPKYRTVHLEAPIANDATDERWENYFGTHILEVGWRQIEDLLAGLGFAAARGAEWRTFTR